jgi:arginine decarboxylase
MRKRVDIVWGEGKGNTEPSAYDAALMKAGIANFNLVLLSSIIPPGSIIREQGTFEGAGTGKVLPVVLASAAGRGPHVAGLGWVTAPEGGLLMEASGSDENTVISCINQGLHDMMTMREWDFSDISFKIKRADYALGCAIVAAVFVIPRLQFLEWFWTSPSTGGVHPEG